MIRKAMVSVLALVAAQGAAQTVIYSEIASSGTSMVPGLGGALFDSFDRPYASADGSWWIISASSDLDTSEDEVLIVGSGTTGAVVVREGTQADWAGAGELVGLIDQRASINNSGHYAFATNLGGTASTSADEQIVMYNGAFSAVATEGDAVPGFPSDAYGTSLDSASITNAGAVSFRAPSTSGALGSDDDDFLISNGAVFAQENNTVPGGASDAWDNFDTDDFSFAADGTRWLAQGDLTGDSTTDDVVVVNGSVAIREGGAISGISGVVETIVESTMHSNGDWFARGDMDSQDDWLVYNGELVAKTDDAVPGGLLGETLDDTPFSATFFSMTGDGDGNFVYGATTSNADTAANAVLVYNNEFVLLREGDAVDVDGNGLFDDGAYLSVFNNDDAFLTPDGWYYFTADLIDDAGGSLGQAFMRIQVPAPGAMAPLALGGLMISRRRR